MNWENLVNIMPKLLNKLKKAPLVTRDEVNNHFHFTGGVYVFYENGKPLYAGRTKRYMSKRVLIHSRKSSNDNSASFAFLLAKEKATRENVTNKITRKDLMRAKNFVKIFLAQKIRISKMKVRCVEVSDPEAQAIFEIYASKHLNTRYNDFNTH